MSNTNGLDLIRDAFSKAIAQNIENNNFSQIKFLVENLEKLTVELQTTPVNSPTQENTQLNHQSNLFNIEPIQQDDFGVDFDTMREFVLKYVATHGESHAEDVTNSFEKEYKHRFTSSDLSIPSEKSSPRWRNRFHSVVVKLRADGVLMPHKFPYFYKYAFTPKYLNSLKEDDTIILD